MTKRVKQDGLSTSYDGLAEVKEVDIVGPEEEAKPIYIAKDLTLVEENELITLLKEFKDCFVPGTTKR